MACELQKLAAIVALGNAIASTPGVAVGVVAPPLEPLIAAKMWLSWVGVLIALKFLSDCLEQNGRQEDAASLRREVDKLRREMDEIKRKAQ
jgi:hypothetical protein